MYQGYTFGQASGSDAVPACDDLYMQKPGDDTTVAVARVIERKVVNIFTGPPKDMDDDERIMLDFITSPGKHIVSGGTTAALLQDILKSR